MSNKQEEEFNDEMERLKDALKHKAVRSILWEQTIKGKELLFSKFITDSSNNMFRSVGKRDMAVDMFVNIMETDLEMGLQMIRENWKEGGD